MFQAAVIQLRSCENIDVNIEQSCALIRAAAAAGADYIQTPEMTNLLVRGRDKLFSRIAYEDEDNGLRVFQALAKELDVILHIGSLAVRTGEDKAANRGYFISRSGEITARYDKIHMFDVDLPDGGTWRESATYQPGSICPLVVSPWCRIGVAICYDVRFPQLFRAQAKAGAKVLTAPAAFTRPTGEAHWHVLQRSRAIENGAYMISAAQGGKHEDGRETFGHSLIVSPWGEVIGECDGDEPGFAMALIDPAKADEARQRIPALANERAFEPFEYDQSGRQEPFL